MIKFKINKITGDNSLESFKKQGILTHFRMLNKQDHLVQLHAKLMEESLEVAKATSRHEVIGELADVYIVLDALMKQYEISHDELMIPKKTKLQERGGFEKGIFLESIEMDENNPRVKHFHASPDKYPEIK